jgi:hypothetical protein
LLDLDTLYADVALVLLGIVYELFESSPDICYVLQPDYHTARFGFVEDIVRDNFQHHGETQPCGYFRRL